MNDPRLTKLIDLHLDGALTPEEKVELENLLRGSEAARQQFWRHAGLHHALHEQARVGQESTNPAASKITPFSFPSAAWLRLAAAVAVGLFLGWLLKSPAPQKDLPVVAGSAFVAQVRFADAGLVRDDTRTMPASEVLPVGPLRVGPGVAEIEFFDGARVVVQGPAQLDLLSPAALVLHSGRLSATVPERATGFRVLTPAGEVIDLGTRFGVSVDPAGKVETHVFEGRVDWRGIGGQTARVREREAISVEANRRMQQMAARPDTFPETESVFEALLVNGSFEDGSDVQPLDIPSRPGIWSGDRARVVEATLGITPADGHRMLEFIGTGNDRTPPTQNLTSSEQWQIVDLRKLKQEVVHNEWVAEVSARFNRVRGDERTDTRFSVGLMAFAGDPKDADDAWENRQMEALARVSRSVVTDDDPQTWQAGQCEMTIPREADYLLLHVSAVENMFNDPDHPEFAGHFVDRILFKLRRLPVPALALANNP